MADRPHCRQCMNLGEDQIHKHFVVQEQQLRKRAEKEKWSAEALDRKRRELARAQKNEIRVLRDMTTDAIVSAEAREFTDGKPEPALKS